MKLKAFILVTLFVLACTPQKKNQPGIIRIKGSDTMIILAERWAEAYMTIKPQTSIYTEGGGSSEGIKALINGEADIAMTSRLIRPQEASQLASKYRSIGISYLVAKDALSIFVNLENSISNLSVDHLRDIFSGKIKNWKQLGAQDLKIVPVIRPPGSGSYFYFKEYIMENEEYAESDLFLPTTSAVIKFVSENKGAIGYGGTAYAADVKTISVNGVAPSEKNVQDDLYYLSRYLYLYTISTPDKRIQDFIDWIIGPAGQFIIRDVGYFPLWSP